MNESDESPVPLRPMSLGDVLDGAFRLTRARWRALVVLVAVVAVPVQIVVGALQTNGFRQPGLLEMIQNPGASDPFAGPAFTPTQAIASVGAALVGWVADLILVAAIVVVVAAAMEGRRTPAGEALRASWRRGFALIGVVVLEGLVAVVIFLPAGVLIGVGAATQSTPLLVAGVVALLPTLLVMVLAYALFYVAVPVMMIERLGPAGALRRSWQLVRPRRWWVAGVALLTALLQLFLAFAFGIVIGAGTLFGGLVAGVLGVLGAVGTSLVTVPLQAAVPTLVYFDGRVRQEGLDLVVQGRAIGADTGGSTAANSSATAFPPPASETAGGS